MRIFCFLLIAAAAGLSFCSASSVGKVTQLTSCFAIPSSTSTSSQCKQLVSSHSVTIMGKESHAVAKSPVTVAIIGPLFSVSSNDDDIEPNVRSKRGLWKLVSSIKRSLSRARSQMKHDTKRTNRQKTQKIAAASLAFLYLATFRLRPAFASTLHNTQTYEQSAQTSAVATSDTSSRDRIDGGKVVFCKGGASIPGQTDGLEEIPGAPRVSNYQSFDESGRGANERGEIGDTEGVSGIKPNRKERKALRMKQKQEQKQKKRQSEWDDYDDDDVDEEIKDFPGEGVGTATSDMEPGSGTGMTPAAGYMPPGAKKMSSQSKSNLQAKVVIIAGGGYALSCIGYEGFQWNKEQKRVETSIEILKEQAIELGLVGMNETNVTATDEEIADELRNMGNATDTSEEDGEKNREGDTGSEGADDDDDDNDEPEPPRSRKSPRKPIRPSDDDDGGDWGDSGGVGDGRPSADDLDRLNNLFKK